ncbi:hypothetical protein RHGRI_008391 [Rhododendron griersonianum]|uniref:DUF4408 domain-containing protein n=1 Tax=Rhododendron griersonianum TaxID=479676 RepID=A0AAV6L266_9ERIC|nr:hypothetical protein RHGRI_008391 [Rhododendron griersonianum]
MLNSTIELITLAASNSLVVFCFCNLIIAVLLVGGSKPGSEFGGQDSCGIPTPTFTFRSRGDEEEGGLETTCSVVLDKHNASSTGVSEACDDEKATVDEEKENVDDGDDDDELRRRVEEFIDKINEGWKAERLRTSLLV